MVSPRRLTAAIDLFRPIFGGHRGKRIKSDPIVLSGGRKILVMNRAKPLENAGVVPVSNIRVHPDLQRFMRHIVACCPQGFAIDKPAHIILGPPDAIDMESLGIVKAEVQSLGRTFPQCAAILKIVSGELNPPMILSQKLDIDLLVLPVRWLPAVHEIKG
jgi:hypothetical protein